MRFNARQLTGLRHQPAVDDLGEIVINPRQIVKVRHGECDGATGLIFDMADGTHLWTNELSMERVNNIVCAG